MHKLFTIWTALTESKEERHKHASKEKQQNATDMMHLLEAQLQRKLTLIPRF